MSEADKNQSGNDGCAAAEERAPTLGDQLDCRIEAIRAQVMEASVIVDAQCVKIAALRDLVRDMNTALEEAYMVIDTVRANVHGADEITRREYRDNLRGRVRAV